MPENAKRAIQKQISSGISLTLKTDISGAIVAIIQVYGNLQNGRYL